MTSIVVGASILTGAGRDLLIRGVVSATQGVISGIGYLARTDSNKKGMDDISSLIDDQDLEAETKVVEAFVGQLTDRELSPAEGIALQNLQSTIESIGKEFEFIRDKTEASKDRYRISRWWYGDTDLTPHFGNLKRLDRKFHQRFDLLVKILQ